MACFYGRSSVLLIENMYKHRSVLGTVLCVESGDSRISWLGGPGNIEKDDSYFNTSVTKLCISAIILRLSSENQLQLDDGIKKYLGVQFLDIHVMNGVNYTDEITIKHLLAHTSGLPDYLAFKQANGKTGDYAVIHGIDEPWPLDRVLEIVRNMKPKFKPGQKGKAQYSNTNYRLLGTIVERIVGKTIGDVFQEYLFNQLQLSRTYAYKDTNENIPVPMYYKTKELRMPRCMASVTAEGGVVSTAKEFMVILRAFFNGFFFPRQELDKLNQWNFCFLPYQLYLGVGLEKLWLPRVVTGVKPISDILGFWGSSGAFAFHHPDTDLYFTGTVNQSSGMGHKAAFKAMINIVKSV